MSAESKMIEYASCRQVKSPYDNGDKDANTDSRQVVGKLDDRAISLKAVMDIVSDMRDLCRQDVLQDTLKQLQQLPPVKLQPCEDAISRQAIIDMLNDIDAEVNDGCGYMYEYWMDYIKQLPGVTPERPKSRCKDCKFFEYDSIAKVDGIPLIVAHEICNKWGDGCKSREDGYCFLFEPREDGE